MKIRYLTLLIFLVGCKSGMITQKSSMNIPDREFSSSYAGNENNIAYYSTNEFTAKALKAYTLDYLKSAFAGKNETNKTPGENLHDNSIVDTIYLFSDNSNAIEYYKGSHAIFIEVTDRQFDLYGGISARTRKDDFKKASNIENEIGDVVNIGNSSQTAIYTFYFRNNKIQRISSFS